MAGGAAPGEQNVDPMTAFANAIAKSTGIDPRVAYAWARLETGNNPPSVTEFNYLNLRPYSSDVGVSGVSTGGFDEFNVLGNAEISTERRIKQPFIWDYLGPVVKKHGDPSDEIAAIAASDWDSGHYGGTGGPNLRAEFESLYGAKALGNYSGSSIAPGAGGQTQAQTALGLGLSGLGSGLEAFAYQALFVLIGLGFALLGLFLVARALMNVGAPAIIHEVERGVRIRQAGQRIQESQRASMVREGQASQRIEGQTAQRNLSEQRLRQQERVQTFREQQAAQSQSA